MRRQRRAPSSPSSASTLSSPRRPLTTTPSRTGATIGWTTDEPSNSQVEYGLTNAYGSSTTLDAALVTSHSQALTGLASNTLYHYRVKSRDGGNNLTTSADFTSSG